MKKKLNLLWNLKFNFFSVAERPLTFFAYFLNAKKVGRRRLVISPAKAGAFLFSHTRLPVPAPAEATTDRAVSRSEMEPNGDKRRGFAVGAPARRGRDGNGKIAVRGGEAMAAKRTTAQGGFAQRNAARDFARQTQKAGPVTGQPGFAAGEMRPNGSKGRGGNGSRVWEKRKASAFAGPITKSADGVTFLMLRK